LDTNRLRPLDQATMNLLYEATDALGLSREALRVALLRVGEGEVRRVRPGLYEITLPEQDDLAPFFSRLAGLLRAADEDATDHGVGRR
jgi:hypothetical protein